MLALLLVFLLLLLDLGDKSVGEERLAGNDFLMELVKLGEDWHLAGEVDHLVPVADVVHEFLYHRHVAFWPRDADPF